MRPNVQPAARKHERIAAEVGQRLFTRLGLDLHDGALRSLPRSARSFRLLKCRRRRDRRSSSRRGSTTRRDARPRPSVSSGTWQGPNLPALVSGPFAELLQDETARAAANGVDVEARLTGDLDRCTPSQRIALLRCRAGVALERRAPQRRRVASVVVSAGETSLLAEVVDRGNGFDYEGARTTGRLGLVGMAERIRLSTGRSITAAPAARRPSARRSRAGVRRARPRRGRG